MNYSRALEYIRRGYSVRRAALVTGAPFLDVLLIKQAKDPRAAITMLRLRNAGVPPANRKAAPITLPRVRFLETSE